MALDGRRIPRADPGRLAGYWAEPLLARAVDPARDIDDPQSLPAARCYPLQNCAAFLASRASAPADLRRALAAQRSCAQIRELVTSGEVAEYDAKYASARTSRQAAAATVSKLLTVTDLGDDYQSLLAEGVEHTRAAIENQPTRAMISDRRPTWSAWSLLSCR